MSAKKNCFDESECITIIEVSFYQNMKNLLNFLTIVSLTICLLLTFEACSFFQPSVPKPNSLSSSIDDDIIQLGDTKRSFHYYVPMDLPDNSPLVIILHGSRGSGQQMRRMTAYHFDLLAENRQFIAVYPDGYEGHWNGCRQSANDTAHTLNIDDTGFVEALIEYFIRNNNINKNCVFLAGFSNGGHMCFRLASEIPEKIAAIAVIAAHVPVKENSSCSKPSKPISALFCSGTKDPINPFQGGEVSILGLIKKGQVVSAIDSANYFWEVGNINDETIEIIKFQDKDVTDESDVRLWKWQNTNGIEINLFIIEGGGHTIPGTPQYYPSFIVGKTNHDIHIANEVVSFFLRQKT